MGVCSDGSDGIEPGLIYSFLLNVRMENGQLCRVSFVGLLNVVNVTFSFFMSWASNISEATNHYNLLRGVYVVCQLCLRSK